MIPETENQQKAKSACPDKPAWHAKADPGRYLTSTMLLVFSWDGSYMILYLESFQTSEGSPPEGIVNCRLTYKEGINDVGCFKWITS